MANPKLDKAMQLLVALERNPMSSHQLAATTGFGRATVVRLVTDLRELGCKIESQRGAAGEYELKGWGVFDSAAVKRYLKGKG
ncbi:MAG: HTH domain-containing protein [Pseudomonadota bacterium]